MESLSSQFMPHGHCYLWTQGILWSHVFSDILIFLAYLTIPMSMFYVLRKKQEAPLRWVFYLFAVFILSCGMGHIVDVWNVWHGEYWISASVRVFTALVSVLTAGVLWRLIPTIVRLPTIGELEREIRSRKLVEAELPERKNELEQLFYSISHDLRSPLVSLQGFSALLMEAVEDREWKEAEECGVRVQRASDRLESLVDDLLEMGKVSHSEVEFKVVSVAGIMEDIQEMLSSNLNETGVVLSSASALPDITADETRVRLILQNLITNAIRYGCSGAMKKIEVGYQASKLHHKFFVRNRGEGVPEQFREKIFNLFQRLDTHLSGSGLGLTIVRKAARVMGGDAWYQEAESGGSEFWFSLAKKG